MLRITFLLFLAVIRLANAIISSMNLTYTVDNEAGAAYLSLGNSKKVASTLNYQQDKNLDFDADGNLVGIEFLSFPPSLDVSGLADYAELNPEHVVAIQSFLAKIAD